MHAVHSVLAVQAVHMSCVEYVDCWPKGDQQPYTKRQASVGALPVVRHSQQVLGRWQLMQSDPVNRCLLLLQTSPQPSASV